MDHIHNLNMVHSLLPFENHPSFVTFYSVFLSCLVIYKLKKSNYYNLNTLNITDVKQTEKLFSLE